MGCQVRFFPKSLCLPAIEGPLNPRSLMKISLAAMLAILVLAPPSSFAAQPNTNDANVILLTLDGVRWEEVFKGVDPGQSMDSEGTHSRIFDYLTGTLTQQGPLIGNKEKGERVTVSNPAQNSLPAYQSIMAGATQPCTSNACGRIHVETFPERILQDLQLKKEEVATFASWEKIANAVEHVEGTTLVNAGIQPLANPSSDAETDKVNREQAAEKPSWSSARLDKFTFAHALHYLKARKPRFLFISLNDSDEWGHKGDYTKYVQTLRQHDEWIKELVATIDGLGEYGKHTSLIITTDHGRGVGNDWNEHGSGYANSGSIWLYGRTPFSRSLQPGKHRGLASSKSFAHVDIRPTIETLFGLSPKLDGVTPLPGHAIRALTGN
jgi:hypothetical protein